MDIVPCPRRNTFTNYMGTFNCWEEEKSKFSGKCDLIQRYCMMINKPGFILRENLEKVIETENNSREVIIKRIAIIEKQLGIRSKENLPLEIWNYPGRRRY